MAGYQYAFVMKGLTKAYPGGKPVFKDLFLSFLPGAKIAVIGPNGAGKSTLMKIIAGHDKDFQGEAWAAEGVRVGYLEQEPHLDPAKTVRENVTDGVRPIADMVERFNAIAAEMAEPKDDTDFDALLEEMGTRKDRRGRRLDSRQPA
jgi:ATPase subunit of ABC transporter with duplicated ATPase domains